MNGLDKKIRPPVFRAHAEIEGKGALEKLALAWWVSQKIIVSRRWLSQRLAMGDESRITQAIRTVKAIRSGRLLRMRCKLPATADGMT